MVKLIVYFMLLGLTFAIPASNEFDKVSADDVEINSIHTGNKYNSDVTTQKQFEKLKDTTTKNTVDLHATFSDPPGTSFARIIDDIFNIPISVLQSVAKLLTNPFKQTLKSPEDSKTY